MLVLVYELRHFKYLLSYSLIFEGGNEWKNELGGCLYYLVVSYGGSVKVNLYRRIKNG